MAITSSVTCTISPTLPGTTVTHGFAANMAAQWPGCACWIPIPPYASDAYLQAIADEMAPYLLANSTVVAECGLENWNFPSFPTGWASTFWGNLLNYYPSGTQINSHYQSQGAAIDLHQAHCAIAGHAYDVLQNQFDTHNKGIKVQRLFGSQLGQAGKTDEILQFCSIGAGVSPAIPIGSIAIAPYLFTPSDTPISTVCNPFLVGTATVSNGSTTVTTSNSQSAGEIGQTWQFVGTPGDTSFGSYVVQSGSGTSWVISPAFGGANASGVKICSTSLSPWGGGYTHDFLRHWLKYSFANFAVGTGPVGNIATYYTGPTHDSLGRTYAGQVNGLPSLVAYEAEIQRVDPNNNAWQQHDWFYASQMYDSLNTAMQTWQDSGFTLANIQSRRLLERCQRSANLGRRPSPQPETRTRTQQSIHVPSERLAGRLSRLRSRE